MSGRSNRRKEVVQINADWLLGQSPKAPVRIFSWFPRICFLLVCILATVWSWPYASKQWLKWEWQQQLALASNRQNEDVLPILLALSELSPTSEAELVQQMATAESNERLIAFRLLEQRLEQWRKNSSNHGPQMISLVKILKTESIQASEAILLRAKLAMQLRPLIEKSGTDAPNTLASIDAMILEGEPTPILSTAESIVRPVLPPKSVASSITTASQNLSTQPTGVSRLLISDTTLASAVQRDLPTMVKLQSHPDRIDGIANESRPVLTSMRTLTDQASTVSTPHLPNLNISIPRTIPTEAKIRTSSVALTPSVLNPQSSEDISTQPPTHIPTKGYDKLTIEKLLPLLTSAQPKIVEQAFHELARRGLTPSQLEIAMSLAQGDVEQRLASMEMISKDPSFNDSITWLFWMAESSDRNVRRRAIVLLGSMTSPVAMRKLRILESRESDETIRDQIKQVLLASGTASISVR